MYIVVQFVYIAHLVKKKKKKISGRASSGRSYSMRLNSSLSSPTSEQVY